jgi:branched-chain amino acid transport system substrate-binding protein
MSYGRYGRGIWRSGIAALAVLAVGGVGAAGAQEMVRLGSLSAVTGPIPALVADIVAGEQFAIQQINEQGGVLGGRQLELVIADGQCDPGAAVDAAQKLIHVDQVVAIVGGICSGETIAAAESVAIPAGVVMVSPASTSPAISELDDNDLIFRTAPSDAYQGVVLAQIARDIGYERMALTYTNDDYNAGLAEVFREAFAEMGGEIVAEQMHEPGQASYRSELASLAQGDPEALMLFAYYDGAGITIMRQALEAGYFEKFMGADGMVDQAVIDQLGADALRDNVVFTTSASDEEAGPFRTFAEAFEASGAGVDPGAPYVARGYDATWLLALAIEHAGSADRAAISESLRAVATAPGEEVGPGEWERALELIAAGQDIQYVGAAGRHEFDENGDVTGVYSRNTVGEEPRWMVEIMLD